MKFTAQQVEDFRHGVGCASDGAEQAMQEVAKIIEARIRSEIDDEALRDGDSFYRGMCRAADIVGEA